VRSTGLRGDRIGDDDADQRSQEPLGLDSQSEYAAHANGTIDPACRCRPRAPEGNFTREELGTVAPRLRVVADGRG
jgi:hypothetical protein